MADASKPPLLIVEDEDAIRDGLCDVLAYHGYRPTAVATGEEGLELGRSGGFELVLLDVMLPAMSGFDVCRELRASAPDLAIMMLTAKGAEDDVVNGLKCGADDYMTKPFSVRELVARVAVRLRSSSSAARARAQAAERDGEPTFQFGPWLVDKGNLTATTGQRTPPPASARSS